MSSPDSTLSPAAPGVLAAPPALVPAGATRLLDWGVISALGADAGTFLQGQLTNDVQSLLPEGSARLAGYCSPKGRLLATFVVWRAEADRWLLACSADLLPAVLKRLSMYVLRARCKMTDASAELPLWGLAGEPALSALAATGLPLPAAVWSRSRHGGETAIRLPDALVDGVRVPRALKAGGAAPPDQPPLDLNAWQWLEACSGTPRVMAATSEQFVPQMVNLELVGGVNFQKGCYPGQEVVARSQYRGTLKRRGFLVGSAQALEPGQEIFHSADPAQPAGMVVLAGSHQGSHAALVELKLAAAAEGELHARTPDGPRLRLAPLPYAIPAEAA